MEPPRIFELQARGNDPNQRGFLLENARRYDEAIKQLRGVIAVGQNHYQAHWMLGHTYAVNGQFDQAIAAAEKAVALSERSPGALGMLGMIYGLAGRKGEATKTLKELIELNERRYVTPAALVYVYTGLGGAIHLQPARLNDFRLHLLLRGGGVLQPGCHPVKTSAQTRKFIIAPFVS